MRSARYRILADISEFPPQIFDKKKYPKPNYTKIRPVGASLIQAERQTDGRDGGDSRFSPLSQRAKIIAIASIQRVSFQFFAAVELRILFFWDMTLSQWVIVPRHVGRTHCLHLQGPKSRGLSGSVVSHKNVVVK